jgi:mannose-6-phosphate isomerase-like protein (cupin superfamily)
MADVKIIRSGDVEPTPPAGSGKEAGWTKRIVFPPHVITKNSFFLAVSEVNPGQSPHRWHHHLGDKGPGHEIIYPKDFEEVYHIVSGNGVVQWKTETGKTKEEKVGKGDTIFFPVGVGEHQLLNNGPEKMAIVICGAPTHKITYSDK